MRLKSYFAGTVESAMALAREELGPEAMLVHSKRTQAEARQFGHYEVVFALEEPEPPQPNPALSEFARALAPERKSAIEKLSLELNQLKQRVENLSVPLAAPAPPPRKSSAPSRSNAFLRPLIDADTRLETAQAIGGACPDDARGPAALRTAVESFVCVDATLGVPNASRKIVALVGPPGTGKTTALIKLAIRFGLSSRRSLHLLSTDVYKVGGAEQLRLYASILGVGFQAIETPLALAQALEENRRKDLIFVDTPGWAHHDIPEIRELASYLAGEPDIDVHLVLPASNRPAELERIVDRYAVFQPRKLIFTRIDETDRHGPLLSESHRTGKPISFLCGGQRIPEDIEPATAVRVAELVLGPAPHLGEPPNSVLESN